MAKIESEAWLDSSARREGHGRTTAAVREAWLNVAKSNRSRTTRQPASEVGGEFLVNDGLLKRMRAR
jgi:hypothetical protein